MTDSFKFIENAHELDKVLHHAQKAKESGQPARNMYESVSLLLLCPGAKAHVVMADSGPTRVSLSPMQPYRYSKKRPPTYERDESRCIHSPSRAWLHY